MTRISRRRSPTDANGNPAPPEADTSLGMLPDLIGYHVRLAQIAIFADFDEALARWQLSPGLFALLVIIEANPGLRQSQLARAAHLDRSTLVPALDKLEARGLVERRAAPDDRRSNGLWLTDEARPLLAAARSAVDAHERAIAAELSAEERSRLLDLLDRLAPHRRR